MNTSGFTSFFGNWLFQFIAKLLLINLILIAIRLSVRVLRMSWSQFLLRIILGKDLSEVFSIMSHAHTSGVDKMVLVGLKFLMISSHIRVKNLTTCIHPFSLPYILLRKHLLTWLPCLEGRRRNAVLIGVFHWAPLWTKSLLVRIFGVRGWTLITENTPSNFNKFRWFDYSQIVWHYLLWDYLGLSHNWFSIELSWWLIVLQLT